MRHDEFIRKKFRQKGKRAFPIKGKGIRKKRSDYKYTLKVGGRREKPNCPYRRLVKPPKYGCQLGRIRLDFQRTGHDWMSPVRFARLLGLSIERYLQLETGSYKKEPTATQLIKLFNRTNAIREHYGLPRLDINEFWRVEP